VPTAVPSRIWRCDPRKEATRASSALSGKVSMLRLPCLRSGRAPVVQVRAACTSGLAAAFGASFCHGVAGRERRSTPYASSLSHQPRGVSLRRSRRMCGAMLSACRALRAMERASTTSWPGPVTPWCSSAVSASTLASTGRSSTRSPAATACSPPTTAVLAQARSPTHRTATR
jgi:hypothetical protein